jgi:hypothetical protein
MQSGLLGTVRFWNGVTIQRQVIIVRRQMVSCEVTSHLKKDRINKEPGILLLGIPSKTDHPQRWKEMTDGRNGTNGISSLLSWAALLALSEPAREIPRLTFA